MKLDFLTSLQQLGPCGLRPVIDTLSDSYPVMVFGFGRKAASNE